MARFLFVHAHPDDESLFSGALIAYLSRNGEEVFVLTGTRGEQGKVVPGRLTELATTQELTKHRIGELVEAVNELQVTGWCFLGTPPARVGNEVRNYHDSGMKWITETLAGPDDETDDQALTKAPLTEVVADIAAYAKRINADVVVSYDEDGSYGHPDHVYIQQAAKIAATQLGLPFRALVYEADAAVDWFELDELFPVVSAALSHYQSQLTVAGHEVVHCEGQRQKIITRMGLS